MTPSRAEAQRAPGYRGRRTGKPSLAGSGGLALLGRCPGNSRTRRRWRSRWRRRPSCPWLLVPRPGVRQFGCRLGLVRWCRLHPPWRSPSIEPALPWGKGWKAHLGGRGESPGELGGHPNRETPNQGEGGKLLLRGQRCPPDFQWPVEFLFVLTDAFLTKVFSLSPGCF